ncbi:MAG: DUF4169 family protein [Pseudomonadota bacterium]
MTGKVINLRAARKAKARGAKRKKANENAAQHGRTTAERTKDEDAAKRAARHLDDHKTDPGREP